MSSALFSRSTAGPAFLLLVLMIERLVLLLVIVFVIEKR